MGPPLIRRPLFVSPLGLMGRPSVGGEQEVDERLEDSSCSAAWPWENDPDADWDRS